MISYFIELNEYKPQNRKCAEMAEFANQFGNTLCPDKISFDAFKTELEAKVMPVHPTEHVLLKSYTNSLYKQSTSYLNWAAILLY